MSRSPSVVDTEPGDLAHSPEVPPHRFTTFFKGEHFAYARGLEVNPTHLPKALDEMLRDGWELLSIFGQTDSQHVGFIFRRVFRSEKEKLVTEIDRNTIPAPAGWHMTQTLGSSSLSQDKLRQELERRGKEQQRKIDLIIKPDRGRGQEP